VVCVGHVPTILYESPDAIVLDPDLQISIEEDAEKVTKANLKEQVQKIRETGGEVAGAHIRLGDPDAEMVGLAGRLSAGLIVMSAPTTPALRRALLGSVSDSVVRHAHCPVLVVRNAEGKA
jgi:nucleotide-binding universal stress UspA family protein